jgi:cobalt/nickel transport system permease protein
MIPVWLYASYRLNKTLRSKQVPLLALAAAFAFVIMMFNIPMPGGTSGHMVGAALIAIILGPWAAVVTMTVTLAIQAFVMRDGGVTAIGANCFTMAFLMPVSAYVIYRLISGRSEATSARRLAGAVIAAYASLIIGGVATGLILGGQNIIYPPVNGQAQYFPYDLNIAVPAMLIDSLFFGLFEALMTGLVFAYIQKNDPSLIAGKKKVAQGAVATAARPNKHLVRNLIIGLLVLVILTPIGLIATGDPFGEWDVGTIQERIGYVPSGMSSGISNLWNSPLSDYGIAGFNAPIGYILAALVGVAICSGLVYVAMIWAKKKEKAEE